MSIELKLICIAAYALLFFSGWLIGKSLYKKNGVIRIETNEDGSRDVVRFILDLDLEDIRQRKYILLKVEDLSKKTQSP